MNSKRGKIRVSALLITLIAGVTVALAYFTATDSANNIFKLGNQYTLTYHANTEDDSKVTNIPEQQKKYGDGNNPVTFNISKDKPLRPGFVFKGWYDKRQPADTDIMYGKDGEQTYTAPVNQKNSDLYAQWDAGYTLIYDPNGGEGMPDVATNQGSGVEVSEIDLNKDGVLYKVVTAKSAADVYTFTRLGTQGQMTGPKHQDPANPDDPNKKSSSNRVFLGWSTKKDATEPDYTSNGKLAYANTTKDYDKEKVDGFLSNVEIKAEENPDKTVTLYAVWATKYELKFSYHPEMVKPKTGNPAKLQKPITLVSATEKAPTFNLVSQVDADTNGWTPTREDGYRWGWWGDNLERFKFNKPGEGQSAAQAGNEGCYQFGEPVPARKDGETPAKVPNWNNPCLTLYAYFQPPSACTLKFDDNTSNTRQFPEWADRNNTYKVTEMPDNIPASFTQLDWRPDIPDKKIPQHSRYTFLGWSEDMNSTDPEYQPGDKAYLNKVLNNEVTLYAIWKPKHNFSLRFNINMPNGSGRIHFKKENGTWDYYTTYANNNNYVYYRSYTNEEDVTKDIYLRKDPSVYFADTTFTWSQEFFENEGLFATRADDTVGTYTFFGWSEEPVPVSTEVTREDADYPVEAPAVKQSTNPSNQGLEFETPVGDQGLIKQAITAEEGEPCTKPTTHPKVLYAVWRKSPKHQLRVIFDKGSASTLNGKGTAVSGSDCHYITINGTTQGSSSYYASIDYPSYTWDVEYWKTKTPSAVKDDDKDGDDVTATYTFLGWTTDENKKTPSTTITKSDIDYPVDDQGRITKEIRVNEKAAQAKDCQGGIHEVKLYPVFRKNPFHVYKLNYDVNAPSTADGIITKLYDDLTGSWKSVQVFPDPDTMDPLPDPKPEKGDAAGTLYKETKLLTETSYEWDLSEKGLFATCDNTGKTPTGEMTFLGWSNKKFKLGEYDPQNPPKIPGPGGEEIVDPSIKFYSVTAPDDPSNPGNAGRFAADTKIKIDVDEQDPKPADACTDTEGKVHTETLYGVWAGEPIHQYSVIFAGNSSKPEDDDVEVLYGKKEAWDEYNSSGKDDKLNKSKATIAKTYKKDDVDVPVKYYDGTTEIALTEDVKNTYRVFSEALPLPKDPDKTDVYQFKPEFWNDRSNPEDVKDLIVKARRNPSADTRYVFDGWNTKKDGTGTNINVDSDEYITDILEVKDTDYDNCDAYTHNIILYAQWKPVKVHNFQLIFYGYNANSLGYMDGTTWRSGNSVKNYQSSIMKNTITDITLPSDVPDRMYYISQNVAYKNAEKKEKFDAEDSERKMSYSWSENGDSGEKLRVMASKNKDTNFEYEFLGWSKSIKTPSETFTASDADYHVDASGYIQEEIKIDEPDSVCGKPVHTLVLYPVFKKVPIHNFSVTLDSNSGNGLRVYNASSGSWSNNWTDTFNYPNSNGTKARVTENSHDWTYDNFWKERGVSAYRNQDSNYTYEFAGWSTTKVEASENPDMSNKIDWSEESRTPSTDENHPNNYVNGFIHETITSSCSLSPCQGGEHNVKLYAIWKRTPRTKTYTLKFNANGGENAPADMNKPETYNGSRWTGFAEFTLTNAQIAEAGMKNKKLVFVGWNEQSNSDQGKYGERITDNTELEQLTQNLTNPYKLSGTAYENEKTLYAVWWHEFNLEYDANGGSNAPEHEHAYTKHANFPFEISMDIPTHSAGYRFLGWSETKTTPGQGTEEDVQFEASTSSQKNDWNVTAAGDPSSDEYGYTGKKLYAVWGPAN